MASDDEIRIFPGNSGWKTTRPFQVSKKKLEEHGYTLDEHGQVVKVNDQDIPPDTAPIEIRPVMVPEYRHDMIATTEKMAANDLFVDHPDLGRESMEWQMGALVRADLYWVSPPMCELLQHAYPTMPPTTLTPDLLPSESGVVFFATPLVGRDAQSASKSVLVQAYVWGEATFNVEAGTRFDRTTPDDPRAQILPLQSYKGNGTSIVAWRRWEAWVPLGRTDWPAGYDTDGEFAPPGFTPAQLASIVEDRRILTAFALLSSQEGIATTIEVIPPRPVQKRLQRRGHKVPKVRLVDIHKVRTKPGQSEGERHVEWTHRWIVRGHWRQQAYGPKRSLRRPVYIASHIKGPDDKPLIEQDVVKVWR